MLALELGSEVVAAVGALEQLGHSRPCQQAFNTLLSPKVGPRDVSLRRNHSGKYSFSQPKNMAPWKSFHSDLGFLQDHMDTHD